MVGEALGRMVTAVASTNSIKGVKPIHESMDVSYLQFPDYTLYDAKEDQLKNVSYSSRF